MKIGIIGAGKWGQAIYSSITQNHTVKITSRTKRDMKDFTTLEDVLKCKYIIIAISTQHIENFLKEKFVYTNQKILIASKGISKYSNQFLIDIFKEYIPEKNLVYLSGPSFADEVLNNQPTALVFNSKSKKLAKVFARYFPYYIKTYISKDVVGAEIAGAYKNILAIASGMSDGLNLGQNARAVLISRGLVEMCRFGKHFGAKKKTFIGLSGAGDLFLTASSSKSRNYRVGYALAQGKSLDVIIEELGEVAEGIATTKALYDISNNENIYVPIASEVFYALNGKKLEKCIDSLMNSK